MRGMKDWLEANAIVEVECVVADSSGIARGKILPIDKFLGALAGHDLWNLLPHGLPDYVSFSQAVAGERLQNQQHLVLVDYDPVGVLKDLVQAGVRRPHGFASMFGINKRGNLLHRSWPVQRYHRRHVA